MGVGAGVGSRRSLEEGGAEIDPEREVEGLLLAEWSFALLTPLQNLGSGSARQSHPALATGPSPPFQCPCPKFLEAKETCHA